MKKYKLIFLLANIIVIVAMVLLAIRGCALNKKKIDAACSGGAPRAVSCPAGETGRIIEICEGGRWKETSRECSASSCSETVFNTNVKPVISASCLSCHSGFDQYATAKAKIDTFLARVNLADANGGRMPKAPNPPLKKEDKDTLAKWKADGLLEACADDTNTNPHIYTADLEAAALKDINSLSSGTQTETRWLYTTHKSNEGGSKSELKQFEAAIQKGINGISGGRNLILAKPVDEFRTLFRFNLNDIKLSVAAWNLIEANDFIGVESNTNIGIVLKGLTKSKKPMLSVDAFLTSVMKANVYYSVRKIPSDLNALLGLLGVNQNAQIDNFQALFLGMIGEISLNKERLFVRYESNDGVLWQTYDANGIAAANKNLSQFPLLKAANAANNHKFDASELLFTLPNNLIGVALFAADGKRADFAPLDVVAHNIKPPADPTIKIQSCTLCHAAGMIPKADTIRASVNENAINFDLRDVDTVNSLYRDPAGVFSEDNILYQNALAKLGILASDKDPISVSLFNIQERNLDAKAVGSQFNLTEEEFKLGLSKSSDGRALVGSLLSGGTISFAQFLAAQPVLVRDLRIGLEPIIP